MPVRVAEVTGRASAPVIAVLAASACTLANPLDELQEPSTSGAGASATASSSSATSGGGTGGSGAGGGGGVAGGGGDPAGGAPAAEVVLDGLEGPDAIAVDDEFVYVTIPSIGQVLKTAKTGGKVVDPLASGDFVIRSLTLDGPTLFWPVYTEPEGSLRRVNTDGSVLYQLIGAQHLPTDVSVRGDFVYWGTTGTGGKVKRAHKVAGDGQVELFDHEAFFFGEGGGLIFYTTGFTSLASVGEVWRIDPDDTNALIANGQAQPADVASNGTHVVWAVQGEGRIRWASVDGGTVHEVASGQGAPLHVVLDGDVAYWTNSGDGRVMRGTIPDNAVSEVAAGQLEPHDIAVDATHVYWTDFGAGTVMRASK